MAGLINWKKVNIPGDNPDSDHVYVGIDLSDDMIYVKDSSGVVTKFPTLANIATILTNYDESTVIDSKISTAISNIIDGSPTVLDTLSELAAAIGNDPDFILTMTTAQNLQDARIVALESEQTTQNNDLNNLNNEQTTQDGRLDVIEDILPSLANFFRVLAGDTKTISDDVENVVSEMIIDGELIINGRLTIL